MFSFICKHCFDLNFAFEVSSFLFSFCVLFFSLLLLLLVGIAYAQFLHREQFNQDLYSTSGVPLTSSSASASSHSPCSPILPQAVALNATQSGGSTTIPTLPLGSLHRSIAKEEDLSSVTRQSDNDGKCQSFSLLLQSSCDFFSSNLSIVCNRKYCNVLFCFARFGTVYFIVINT